MVTLNRGSCLLDSYADKQSTSASFGGPNAESRAASTYLQSRLAHIKMMLLAFLPSKHYAGTNGWRFRPKSSNVNVSVFAPHLGPRSQIPFVSFLFPLWHSQYGFRTPFYSTTFSGHAFPLRRLELGFRRVAEGVSRSRFSCSSDRFLSMLFQMKPAWLSSFALWFRF